jgi:hypothetical protein
MVPGLIERCHKKVGYAAIAVGLALSSVAYAEPGEHIRIGDSTTITPELAFGLVFESNPYLAIGQAQSSSPQDAAIPSFSFRVEPALGIDVDTPKLRFGFDGEYRLQKYFDADVAENLDRFSDFSIKSRIDALPEAALGFRVRESAVFVNRASDNRFFDNSLLSQFRNDLGAGFVIRPGPEFDIELGVDWGYHNFRVPGADGQRGLNNRNSYTPKLGLSWRFFPRTAFVVEASYAANRWSSSLLPKGTTTDTAGRISGDYLAIPNSDYVKGMTGIRGRLTKHLVLVAMVGYGGGFYDVDSVAEDAEGQSGTAGDTDPTTQGYDQNVSSLDGILGLVRAEIDLGYTATKPLGAKITAMYRKDFQDSFFTNYVHQHHIRLGVDSRLGRFVGLGGGFGVRLEDYSGEVERRDVFLKIDGGLLLTPLQWLGIDLGASWVQRASGHTEIQYDNTSARLMLNFSY